MTRHHGLMSLFVCLEAERGPAFGHGKFFGNITVCHERGEEGSYEMCNPCYGEWYVRHGGVRLGVPFWEEGCTLTMCHERGEESSYETCNPCYGE